MCRNDDLSSGMSWVGCLVNDSELFILFAENSQILLKISVIPILLTFMYLVALNLLVNNKLNSSLRQIIVPFWFKCRNIGLSDLFKNSLILQLLKSWLNLYQTDIFKYPLHQWLDQNFLIEFLLWCLQFVVCWLDPIGLIFPIWPIEDN